MQIHLNMASIQKHPFSVSRPHQRGWMEGNKESICPSPQEPPAKLCLTKGMARQESEATLGFLVTHSHGHFTVRMCWWPFYPPPTSISPNAFTLSRTLQSAIQTDPWAQKHSLIGQNRLFGSCGSASPQNVPPLFYHSKRLGGCSGLRARGGGARLASSRGETTASKIRGSYVEHS